MLSLNFGGASPGQCSVPVRCAACVDVTITHLLCVHHGQSVRMPAALNSVPSLPLHPGSLKLCSGNTSVQNPCGSAGFQCCACGLGIQAWWHCALSRASGGGVQPHASLEGWPGWEGTRASHKADCTCQGCVKTTVAYLKVFLRSQLYALMCHLCKNTICHQY